MTALALVCMLAGGTSAIAQQKKAPGGQQAQPQAGQQQPQPAAPQAGQLPAMPDQFKLNLLIRTAIVALNQANQTGNYTVLQDLGAPAFRAANDSARLAQIFAALRQRQVDLSPVLFFTPKLVAQPEILPNGLLRLMGFFPTAPERVNFNLIFQNIAGQWRVFGIGVSTSPADVTAAVPSEGAAQQAQPQAAAPAQAQPPQAQPAAPKTAQPSPSAKPKAVQKPERKSETLPPPPKEKSSAAEGSGTRTVVKDNTTNNVARIDLNNPAPAASRDDGGDAGASGAEPKKEPGFWDSFSLFGTD